MYLRNLLDKLEFNPEESYTKACLKGMAEGALEGLIIVGAIDIISIGIGTIMKSVK